MIAAETCRSCIDNPKSFFIEQGDLEFFGWCFDESSTSPLRLRLIVGERTYECQAGLPRPDVAASFPQVPQAAVSGFYLRTWTPMGRWSAHLEASTDANNWYRIRSFPLCSEIAPLLGNVDFPICDIVEDNPITVVGWAAHPQDLIDHLSLELGGVSTPCHYGTVRADVTERLPQLGPNNRLGFYCQVTAPSNPAPVRLKARLRSGVVAFRDVNKTLSSPSSPKASLLGSLDEYRASMLQFKECKHPKVSIVIPVFNQTTVTLDCLRSISKNTEDHDYEVILVDDNSFPNSKRCFEQVKGVRCLTNEHNIGFLQSCNRGAAVAHGEFLLFLNNDTAVTEGWLSALLRVFENRQDAGLVGAKLIYPDGKLQEAGGIIWQDASGVNYGRYDHSGKPEYNYVREVDYCSGACLLIPKALFEQVGRFDPIFIPAYYEDTDLAFKVRAAGKKVYYQPFSLVMHHEGKTSGTSVQTGVKRYQLINQEKFRAKWADELSGQLPNDTTGEHGARHRGSKLRALVVDARIPFPNHDSGSVRMLRLLGILQELGFQVTFIPEDLVEVFPYTQSIQELGVECLHIPFLSDFGSFFLERARQFDVIILSRAHVAEEILPLCRRFVPDVPTIFDTVDLHFVREQRGAEIIDCDETRRTAKAKEELELSLAKESDAVVVVSSVERDLLIRNLPNQRVSVISNIHEVRTVVPSYEARRGFLFIGGFEHAPNEDGVLWFCREIMPLIEKKLSDATFHIIGSKMPASVRALNANQVVAHGQVESVESFFESCLLSVAPLRFGAGVKGKINQSMSFGVPVVSTSIGAEGMHLTHETDILIADTPREFADQVVRLYRDKQLWSKLSRNGQANVERYFSAAAAKRNLQNLLRDLGVLKRFRDGGKSKWSPGGQRQ